MKQFISLDKLDLEHLIFTFEASLKISRRSQFFLWSQGALQGLIGHETLICAAGDTQRLRFRNEIFSVELQTPQDEAAIKDPVNGLLPRIADEWLRGGCAPLLLCQEGIGQTGRRQLFADLKRRGFGHVLAHGTRDDLGDSGSFFVFVCLQNAPQERESYLIELLLPNLHMAFHRMLAHEKGSVAPANSEVMMLSKREIQILYWVKNGKTNNDIGLILEISPRTVKNHLQNIMRKLNVSNRAQAVGKGSALRLVVPGEPINDGEKMRRAIGRTD